jgi:hypothetical protein
MPKRKTLASAAQNNFLASFRCSNLNTQPNSRQPQWAIKLSCGLVVAAAFTTVTPPINDFKFPQPSL